MGNRPNIIFLMTDQQRFDAMGKVNPVVQTPNLDRLAGESVFFTNGYCTNPSCVPSRAAIMTGKYPSECQVPAFISKLPESETTFMTRLQRLGYYTAVVGKQHFAGSTISRGYDYEMIVDGHFAGYSREDLGAYADYLDSHNLTVKQMYERTLISGGVWKTDAEHHIDYFIGEKGKQWLEDRLTSGEDQPFFLCLSFPGPHHPYDLEGTRYAGMYRLEDMTLPKSTYDDLQQKGPQYRNMRMYSKIYINDYSEEQFRRTKRAYYANMTLIDEKIGEVLDILKKYGAYDNTVIIYTSDHGDFMGDYGLVEKLQCLQDSLMRVPLFVKPAVKDFPGVIVDDLVSNVDIAATCIDVAGGTVPDELSDYSYSQYWDNSRPEKKRRYLYMEAGAIRGILCDHIKTVHYVGRPYGEMYDLTNDSLERVNIWDDPEYANAKIRNYGLMMDSMYTATPGHDTPWNYGTPEI